MSNDNAASQQSGGPTEAVPYPLNNAEIDTSVYPTLPSEEQARYDAIVRRMQDESIQQNFFRGFLARIPPPLPNYARSPALLDFNNRQLPEQIRRTDSALAIQEKAGGPGMNRDIDRQVLEASSLSAFYFFQVYDINDLPGEILVNIFRIACWSPDNPRRRIQTRNSLVQVCKRWRSVMFSDAMMWTSIVISGASSFDRAFAWLDRARNAPLDVRIDDSAKRPISQQRISLLLDRLFEKLPKIRVFVACLQEIGPALVLLEKLKQSVEAGCSINMQRLEVHRMGKPYLWVGDNLEPAFGRHSMALLGGIATPSLTQIAVNGINIDWRTNNFSNLTCLDMRRIPLQYAPTLERFQAILQSSPYLEKLVLDGAGPSDFRAHSRPPPVLMSHLKVLVLGDFSAHYSHHVVQCFNAPNIVDLSLLNFVGEDYTSFFRTTTEAFPNLQILSCTNVGTFESFEIRKVMMKWAMSFPRLKFLRAIECSIFFLGIFLEDPDSKEWGPMHKLPTEPLPAGRRVVCPHLEFVEFNTIAPDNLALWARSRKARGVPIKKLYLPQEYINTHRMAIGPIRLEAPIMIKAIGSVLPEEESRIHAECNISTFMQKIID